MFKYCYIYLGSVMISLNIELCNFWLQSSELRMLCRKLSNENEVQVSLLVSCFKYRILHPFKVSVEYKISCVFWIHYNLIKLSRYWFHGRRRTARSGGRRSTVGAVIVHDSYHVLLSASSSPSLFQFPLAPFRLLFHLRFSIFHVF